MADRKATEDNLRALKVFLEFHRQMEPVWRRFGVMDLAHRAADWCRFKDLVEHGDDA